ncbi:PQQ-dependent sugar dehydrogenase [Ferruginibacter lapsinanis]|uniref:PQQ-dependent sugar dehydrogenase n=1 Tax=Ferruginibacter lapsinanis TaxID=563172 RepID=UPI001E4CCC61|nr:PQQ-dependent sugar dehydrogenase [Ferruginibacter lapsinanis]UEG50822.1 PQQ-dependent sugar dehydrogenase [Ferruginibacter lapsinanis]
MKPASILSLLLCIAFSAVAQPILSLTQVIKNLSSPMQLVNASDGSGKIYIVQKAGKIQVYTKDYDSIGVFVTVTNITSNDERGLLSMAFHPDYEHNGFFYVYYTNSIGDLELARYRVSNNPNIANAASKVILKTIPHPVNQNHNGGELHFGKDGSLYLSTGDGGGGGDQPNNAQNTSVLLGKILRFKVDTTNIAPYYDTTANAENPFANEVVAYGLRNPFRWSFDRLTYDMWIGDVGQGSFEEIDYRPADSIRGINYGWRCYEGNSVYNTSGCGNISNYTFPVYTYPTQDPSAAVTGGTVYRGATYLDLYGYYVAADFFSDTFYLIKYNSLTRTATTTKQVLLPNGIVDFGETENGELYAVSLFANSVYRITASGAVNYVFTGSGSWTNAANWSNNKIPPLSLPAGSKITIDPLANGECVLDTGTTQIISSGATLEIRPNKKFRIIGDLTIQ